MAAKGKNAGGKGAAAGKAGRNRPSVVIRRDEGGEEAAHGGAWKIAYADFVTAMMAFFLLMWLINATTEAQRVGLADYFSQANVLNRGASGEGKPFGGHTPFDNGDLASDRGAVTVQQGNSPVSPHVPRMPQGRQPRPVDPVKGGMLAPQASGVGASGAGAAGAGAGAAGAGAAAAAPVDAREAAVAAAATGETPAVRAALGAAAQAGEAERFGQAAAAMRDAIARDPALAALSGQVRIGLTPDGLSIQIIDSHDRPMFSVGAAAPNAETVSLLHKIAPILAGLGHAVRIAGYTDARPYAAGSVSNWDLSVARADATRAVLVSGGLPDALVGQVSGYADRDLLMPDDPLAAGNRRVAILVSRAGPDAAPHFTPPAE